MRGGNRTALLSEPLTPSVQMGLGGGTPSGPRLAACDLQNNNTDLDVKVVIQTLGISGLLSFNPCPLCFVAVST